MNQEYHILPIEFIIPPNAGLSHIEVKSVSTEVLDGNYKVYPAQPPVAISSPEVSEFVPPNKEVYGSDNLYPDRIAGFTHTGTKAGYRLGSFRVFPIQYIPGKGQLVLYKDIELQIFFESGEKDVISRRKKQIEHFNNVVKEMVINPEDVSKWSPPAGFTSSRNLSPDEVDYVIISLSSYQEEWESLLYWKKKKGLSTKFISKSFITSNYSGDNDQDKSRISLRMLIPHGEQFGLYSVAI